MGLIPGGHLISLGRAERNITIVQQHARGRHNICLLLWYSILALQDDQATTRNSVFNAVLMLNTVLRYVYIIHQQIQTKVYGESNMHTK